jgi:hypothetical protein
MMRALLFVPIPLFGFAWILKPLPPRPIVPTPPVIEGVRVIRLDTSTFRARWSPIADLPPATMIVHVVERERELEPVKETPPARITRRASLDVCARHRMRKVWFGKQWRCRK